MSISIKCDVCKDYIVGLFFEVIAKYRFEIDLKDQKLQICSPDCILQYKQKYGGGRYMQDIVSINTKHREEL